MKKVIIIIAVLIYLPFFSSGIVFAGSEADSFRVAVEEIFDTYSSANMKKDVDTWIALWDDEGIKMSPNRLAINGKFAIEEMKRKKSQNPDDMTQSIELEDAQVSGSGDFGFAHGTFTTTVKPKGGGETKHKEGKFLTIFKKQADGSWKIYRDAVSLNPASK